MRKYLVPLICIIVCCILNVGLVGCGVNSVASPLSTKKVAVTSDTPVATVSSLEKIMKDYNIKLTAKDVQFNMSGTLDQQFVLEGYASLDNYYNYGFSNLEGKFYCIKVTPLDGNYSDSWYLYGLRDSKEVPAISEFFNLLKTKDKIHLIAGCYIPKDIYKSGQGNLAIMYAIKY